MSSKNTHRILEIQEMINRHQSAVKSMNPPVHNPEHNASDEDLSKVAPSDFVGKSDSAEVLKK